MKKAISIVGIAAILIMFTACKSNMRRDVKRLAHKTEQCFSIMEDNENVDSETLDKFNKCYADLEDLMNSFDKKYSDPKASKDFSEMFIEEIRKSDMSNETKETFEQVYSLSKL